MKERSQWREFLVFYLALLTLFVIAFYVVPLVL